MTTKLIMQREPTEQERKENKAEVVFVRDDHGHEVRIFAHVVYEGWEQWGARADVLNDNIPDVERWRSGLPGARR